MRIFLAAFLLTRGKQHRHSSGILHLVTMRVHQRHTNLGISKLGQFPTQNQSPEVKRKQGDPLSGVSARVTQGTEVPTQRISPSHAWRKTTSPSQLRRPAQPGQGDCTEHTLQNKGYNTNNHLGNSSVIL